MAESNLPLISIIIPSYNQGRFLDDCLDSILNQDYRPIEIIVVDGASTDETVARLQARTCTEIRWISEPDKGPADAVNKGLAMASGTIAGIQSVDDFYNPGVLALVARQFCQDPGLGLLYGDVESVSADGKRLSAQRLPQHSNALCIALCVCIPQSSAFFNLQLAQSLGGWRSDYYTCDWELWLRMMFRTQVRKIDRILSARRIYGSQRTNQRDAVRESVIRMMQTSEDIKMAPPEVRRAARAAIHFAQYAFNPSAGTAARAVHLLLGAALYPPAFPHVRNKLSLIRETRIGALSRRLLGR